MYIYIYIYFVIIACKCIANVFIIWHGDLQPRFWIMVIPMDATNISCMLATPQLFVISVPRQNGYMAVRTWYILFYARGSKVGRKRFSCLRLILLRLKQSKVQMCPCSTCPQSRSRHGVTGTNYEDVIKSKPFPRHWPFVRGIHRSLVDFPHKGQWRGALVFSLNSD